MADPKPPVPPAETRPRAPNARARSESIYDETQIVPRKMGDHRAGALLDGRYRLLEVIGHGGMGTVHRAEQVNVGRQVALKTLDAAEDDENYAETTRRFEVEARIVAQLRHPNTVRLIDFGKLANGQLYLVSELLRGCTLDQVIERERALEPIRAAAIIADIADALVEAHDQQIIHRDLKPQNVFLDLVGDRELVRVLDFGIAKVAGARTMTAAGVVVGSPAYVSPEQAMGKPLDAKSDLYSLGVLAHECLTGQLPFRAVNAASMLLKHVHDAPPPLPANIPAALSALIGEMLAKAPEQRPASAREVRDRLRSIVSPPLKTPKPKWISLVLLAAIVAAAAFLLLTR